MEKGKRHFWNIYKMVLKFIVHQVDEIFEILQKLILFINVVYGILIVI